MKFYLNNVQVKVEVAPTITETEDETLDSASAVLEANSQRLPYAPMQQFRVDFENGQDVLYFYVVSDSVEIFSLNPERYRHTLSLVQNTRKLSKHLVRNSSFSQPANRFKESFWATTTKIYNGTSHVEDSCGIGTGFVITLDNREKIANTFIEIDLYGVITTLKRYNTQAEIETAFNESFTFRNYVNVYYNLNGVAQSEQISSSSLEGGQLVFNKKIKCGRIKELLENGATDLYIVYTVPVPAGVNASDGRIILNAKVYAETYYYSAYDILELLRKRQRQTTDTYQRTPLFALPTSVSNPDLYNLLKNTISPNFTFTQCAMYECVAEVFRLFDAIFTLDNNNVLGIEYFNDNDTTTTIESQNKFAGLNISISEDRYTNRLVAYYQDARQERTFPSKNSFAFVRSTTLGVPESNSDHQFYVDKPIYQVVKCELLVNRCFLPFGTGDDYYNCEDFALDITKRVFESSIWTLLNNGSNGDYLSNGSIVKENCINYNKGDTKVNCGEFYTTWKGTVLANFDYACIHSFFTFLGIRNITQWRSDHNNKDPNLTNSGGYSQWYNTKLRLTYISTFDGRTVVETLNNKSDGETLINQNNGAVDLNKMGLNMLGVSLKTGEPQLSGTMQITSWSNRLKKGTKYLDKNNNLWVLNVANYTLYDNCINCSVSFVKNYNELSRRIRINDEKRLSNISAELTQKSEDNIVDFVYYSATQDFSNYQTYTYINYIAGFHAFKNTFGVDDTDQEVQYANVKTYDNDNLINTTYCPLVKYAFGNSLCFEMSFDSPIMAGQKTTYTSGNYYTTAVKYANDSGFVDKIDIKFINTPNAQSFTQDFPQIPALSNYNIRQLEIWKQPNEVFALNYELAFLPTRQNRDFIGQAFLQNNNFIISKDDCKKKFYLYYANDSFQYSVLDIKAHGERKPATINLTTSLMKQQIIVSIIPQSSTTASNWALADEDGNIYFASNYSMSDTTYNIYFQFRKERI